MAVILPAPGIVQRRSKARAAQHIKERLVALGDLAPVRRQTRARIDQIQRRSRARPAAALGNCATAPVTRR